ncbi:hypothetical protein BMS3Bbin02_01830 [bacterium BMS3Bbin02]|nr:hypothetical protein BMS3Bbin02_01830 [bacterium BMS3Bbin02]
MLPATYASRPMSAEILSTTMVMFGSKPPPRNGSPTAKTMTGSTVTSSACMILSKNSAVAASLSVKISQSSGYEIEKRAVSSE